MNNNVIIIIVWNAVEHNVNADIDRFLMEWSFGNELINISMELGFGFVWVLGVELYLAIMG